MYSFPAMLANLEHKGTQEDCERADHLSRGLSPDAMGPSHMGPGIAGAGRRDEKLWSPTKGPARSGKADPNPLLLLPAFAAVSAAGLHDQSNVLALEEDAACGATPGQDEVHQRSRITAAANGPKARRREPPRAEACARSVGRSMRTDCLPGLVLQVEFLRFVQRQVHVLVEALRRQRAQGWRGAQATGRVLATAGGADNAPRWRAASRRAAKVQPPRERTKITPSSRMLDWSCSQI